MKLLIMQCSAASRHFLPLGPQRPVIYLNTRFAYVVNVVCRMANWCVIWITML